MAKSKENKYFVCPSCKKLTLLNGKCTKCGFTEKPEKKEDSS